MKLDKETIIAIIFGIAVIIAWGPIEKAIWPAPPPSKNQTTKTPPINESKEKLKSLSNKESANSPNTKIEKVKEVVKTTVKDVKTTEVKTEELIKVLKNVKTYSPEFLENDNVKIFIDPNAGQISEIILKNYYTTQKVTLRKTSKNIVLFKKIKNGALSLINSLEWVLIERKLSIENKNTPKKTITLRRTFITNKTQKFALTQTWELSDKFTVAYNLKLENLSNAVLNLGEIRITAGSLPNIHELANDKPPYSENHEITYCKSENGKLVSIEPESKGGVMSKMFGGGDSPAEHKPFEEIKTVSAKWIGVTNKYFACILIPKNTFSDGIILRGSVLQKEEKAENGNTTYVAAEVDGLIKIDALPANTEIKIPFEFFAGPKKIPLLKKLDPNATKIMKLYMLGMSFLEPISSFMLYTLLWLQGLCGSYGFSIILLTIAVKTLLWPVTHKANVSMRKMQRIQPLMKEVKEKYKDNSQKANMEVMKLYKEHGVNPAGGCLPILLQMPIFFALYAALSGAVEPRHTSFLWIHDLTLPDTVAVLNLGFANVPINPMMLLMTGTMFLQQKLTPSAGDPMQKKMMMFMPLIMLFMLYSLPSGLTLYWTISQVISIAQLIVNKRFEQRENNALQEQKKA